MRKESYLASLALMFGMSILGNTDVATLAADTKARPITLSEARIALDSLVESMSFLSDDQYLNPIKKRVKSENEKKPLLRVGASLIWGGFLLGHWYCDPKEANFSYSAKSSDRAELHTIRGQFIFEKGDKWTAKITEASRTRLFNIFGKQEYDKIQAGMTITDVVKILGVRPGAYYSGEATFDVHVGRSSAFTGTAKEFEENYQTLLVIDPKDDKKVKKVYPKDDKIVIVVKSGKKAWISNDIAIYVKFNDKGRTISKESWPMRERGEAHPAILEAIDKVLKKSQ